jgi:hypothetical protein
MEISPVLWSKDKRDGAYEAESGIEFFHRRGAEETEP